MLEDKDIQKLIEVFITRDEFNEAISNLANKEDVNKLMTAIDGYAKKVDTYAQEMIMLAHKVDRLEKWVHQIAKKLGMKLEY
jgi:uncharacterized coiled-coil DUF342 family protein